jgi:uncharacterized protein (TIGR00266 family)
MNYEVIGSGGQEFIEVSIEPNETVISEAGAMIFMDSSIEFKAKFSDGSHPKEGTLDKIFSVGKRMLTGESLAMYHYTNKGNNPAKLGLASPYPGTIIGLELSAIGNVLFAERGAYLCGDYGLQIGIETGGLAATLFGSKGLFMQKIIGSGTVVLHASGTIYQKDLAVGESLMIDNGCLVGYNEGVGFEVTRSGSMSTMLFGGEGLLLTKLTGTGSGGTVFLQNLPLSRLKNSLGVN